MQNHGSFQLLVVAAVELFDWKLQEQDTAATLPPHPPLNVLRTYVRIWPVFCNKKQQYIYIEHPQIGKSKNQKQNGQSEKKHGKQEEGKAKRN